MDIDSIKTSVRRKLLGIAAAVSLSSIFQMGYSNAYVNTAEDGFRALLNISVSHRTGEQMTETEYTWIWSVILNSWFPGFALGSCIASTLADFYGRKRTLMVGNLLTFLSVISVTVAVAFEVLELLLISRLGSAIGSGISMCALVLYLQEISPAEMRGTMGFFAEMSFVSMNTFGAIFGMDSVFGQKLVTLVAMAIVPGLLSVLILLPLHETPKFLLVQKNDRRKAAEAVTFYLNLDDDDKVDHFLDGLYEVREKNTSLSEIFLLPHIRLGLLLGIFALHVTTSIWPIVYYSTEFLRRANVATELSEYVSSLMLVLSTCATLIGLLVIDKFSRRGMFIYVSLANVICLLSFVVFSQLEKYEHIDLWEYGCVIAIFGHGITYSFATGPIAWFITSELVPTQYRARCQSISLCINQLTSFALTLIVLPLYNLIDSFALLVLFVVPISVCLMILYKLLPETKGRDIVDIVDELRIK
ncbi:sugar transporter domain-containing protein [Ditylenchus destructor]|nr:sugar transporter domain-containing protein [Ditylenchus destructor]